MDVVRRARSAHAQEGEVADPAFDRASALERMDGDEELLVELAQVFVEDATAQIEKVRAAVQARSAPDIQKTAHTVKGAASNFHAAPTVAAALALEQMGRAAQIDDADAAFARLEQELARLVEELRALAGGAA
jgi:HPt (histidine-containing phosphotransfer) domain-containing protein